MIPNNIDIIVLSGKQGVGKSTLADQLMRSAKVDYAYVGVMKFADTLYELHNYLLNRMEVLTGNKRVEKDGALLQLLGTEWGRKNFGENVWVDILKKQLDKFEGKSRRLIIIDDCRFENEFDSMAGQLRVRLDAPEHIRKPRTQAWRENSAHPSEIGLDRYADEGRFDVYLGTGDPLCTPEYGAELILKKLKERRMV